MNKLKTMTTAQRKKLEKELQAAMDDERMFVEGGNAFAGENDEEQKLETVASTALENIQEPTEEEVKEARQHQYIVDQGWINDQIGKPTYTGPIRVVKLVKELSSR